MRPRAVNTNFRLLYKNISSEASFPCAHPKGMGPCVTRLSRRVSLVEHELLTPPEHLHSPWWVGKMMVNYCIWHSGALYLSQNQISASSKKSKKIIKEVKIDNFNIKSENQSQKCHHRKNNQVVQQR